ncbi:MAG: hypothetical protein J6A55_09060 [Oscillospiraceae bacterium]|nr:hypothetical protein [Oscillospiraceae bacterium]
MGLSQFDIRGNENTLSAVNSMIGSGRIPHSIVIFGEKGLGKKKLASYIAAKLLCSEKEAPCGECRVCRMIANGGHPDFIVVKPSLKSGGYKLEEDLRKVVADSVVAPSESRYKVYLIADMDKTPSGSQNALLKLIEEPPEHTIVILTASSKEYFLKTVLSRVTALGMAPVSRDECERYLKENTERSGDEIKAACEAMGGNIGRCIEFFESKSLKKATVTAKDIAASIASKNEYEILRAFWSLEGDKELALTVLSLVGELLRDAVMIKMGLDEGLVGCSRDSASALASALSVSRLSELCALPEKYTGAILQNSSLALCLNAIVADIKSIV